MIRHRRFWAVALVLLGLFTAARAQVICPPFPPGTTITETEANDTAPTANALTLTPDNYLTIDGAVGSAGDLDYFSFTLAARTGVFFDIDSREIGLSATLNTMLTLYDSSGTLVITTNDNGYDFDTGWPAPAALAGAASGDSALYRDLNPGNYYIRVSSVGGTTGTYKLVIFPDTNYSSTVPVLASNPSAPATLFLDFDGHSSTTDSWTPPAYTIPPFDFNGNPAEFTPGEQKAIRNIWKVVAEDYSPFNINVTTNYTGPFNDRVAHRQVIGNNDGTAVGSGGALGVALLGSFGGGGANNNVAFTFADNFYDGFGGAAADKNNGLSGIIMADALEMGNTSAHEFGHALGLVHYGGGNPQPLGIMHTPDTGLSREIWRTGNTHDGEPPVVAQNDMAVIASPTNGFGVRADDHGNTIATASTMTVVAADVLCRTGIIESPTGEMDYFTFTATIGGSVTIQGHVDNYSNNLNVELRFYDSVGTLLATDAPAASFDAAITQVLTPGVYYVEVRSAGAAGEAGQYEVHVSLPPGSTGPPPPPPPPPGPPPIDPGKEGAYGGSSTGGPEGNFSSGGGRSVLSGPFLKQDGHRIVLNVSYRQEGLANDSSASAWAILVTSVLLGLAALAALKVTRPLLELWGRD